MPCVNLLNGPPVGGYQFGIEGPWQVRGFLVDAPDGSTLFITVEDVDGSGLAAQVARMQSVLDSITFAPAN